MTTTMNDFFVIDDLQHDSNVVNEDNYDTVSSISNEVSFMGNTQIDALYDPYLERAETQFKIHEKDFYEADDVQDAQIAWNNMKQDESDYSYWEDCKREAEIQAQKDELFLENINAKLEIVEKYRKR